MIQYVAIIEICKNTHNKYKMARAKLLRKLNRRENLHWYFNYVNYMHRGKQPLFMDSRVTYNIVAIFKL